MLLHHLAGVLRIAKNAPVRNLRFEFAEAFGLFLNQRGKVHKAWNQYTKKETVTRNGRVTVSKLAKK